MRLRAGEMPPADAPGQPTKAARAKVVAWIESARTYAANRDAGDPGVVLARRLSNAEYNYTIRDLTGVNIAPTQTFPVDPANESGFDNSGESLTMSPALLKKYLAAAREVADHLVMTPTSLHFAPHPVVTDTDRDKYCVQRIVRFYAKQPTDLASYFDVCRQYHHRQAEAKPVSLQELAESSGVSAKYTQTLWRLLHDEEAYGPVAKLQAMFRQMCDLERKDATDACEVMRDYVQRIRAELSPEFPNLYITGSHKGSQPFVLWKNQQYASHRRNLDRNRLTTNGKQPDAADELILSDDSQLHALQLASPREILCDVSQRVLRF